MKPTVIEKGIKIFKTKKVKVCMNCLNETKKCKCPTKVLEVREDCPNCDNFVFDDDNFCSTCGYELNH